MQALQFLYFQPMVPLLIIQEMALSGTLTQLAKAAVLREVQAKRPGKCKAYTAFTAEHNATIGKYALEHGNKTVVKNFKLPD